MTRRILSILMCVLLTLSVMSIAVSAQDETYYLDANEFVRVIKLPEDEVHVKSKYGATLKPRYSNGGDGIFRFYTALNDFQKSAYDQIVEASAGLYTSDSSAASARVELTFTVPDAQFSSFWTNEGLSSVLQGAVSALIEDYPEFFWVGSYGFSGASASRVNGQYVAKIPLDLSLDTDAYANFGTVRSYYDGMMQAIADFRIDGATRYEKLKSIHDQIARAVSYDTDFNNPISHQPTSVFFAPYEPVCEGYAEAFKLLCDKAGIPCIGVIGDASGEAHKWNYVQMEDGKWYGVDLTWDDQDDTMYDFFLVGSNTKDAFFGQGGFLDGHTPTGEEFNGASYTLTYPTLSATSYSLAVPNLNSSVTFNAAENRIHFSKDDTLANQFFASVNYSYPTQISGQTVTISGVTTGATVTVKNGSLTRVYTVSRWGDVDKNNAVNTVDYEKMKNVVAGNGGIAENTAEFSAGDFDSDGVIDGIDLFYMDMYLNNNLDR